MAGEIWKADTMAAQLKPKKRAVLIPIPNKKLFVLGFDEKRVVTIIGYDVGFFINVQ